MRTPSRRRSTRRRPSRCGSCPRPVLTGSDGILALVRAANADPACVGLITWMHTFSPAKMWIAGLEALRQALPAPPHAVQPRDPLGRHRHGLHEPEPGRPRRPGVRVHRRPPAPRAQGGRRPLGRRGGPGGDRRLDARSVREGRLAGRPKIARFGDNMREVAVTEGDKVEAQRRLGFSVNTWGVGDLVKVVDEAADADVDDLVERVPRRVRRRGGAPAGRRPRGEPARRRPDRARPAPVPGGRRLHGVHRHLRGPPRAQAAPGPRRPAPHGRRLRLRRRGRLEDRGHGPRDEGHVRRPARRDVLHGGLHLPPHGRATT